jgi:hypothetical protein
MTDTITQPLSATHGAALARIAELRAQAEHDELVHEVVRTRRGPAWPAAHVAALRDSLRGFETRTSRTPSTTRDACATC